MSENLHIYALEAEADPAIWERMNVYLHLYLLNEAGEQTGMASVDNRNEPVVSGLRVESLIAAARIKLCLYVVPRGLPESRLVSDSPSLTLTLRVLRDGEVIDTLQRRINPWGGDQLVGVEYVD